MKRTIFLAIAVLFSCTSFAQSQIADLGLNATKAKKPWRIKRVGISMGQDFDMIGKVDHTYFTQKIKNSTTVNFAALNLGVDDVSEGWCENPNLRVQMNLEAGHLRNAEIALAFSYIVGRSDGISYYDPNIGNSLSFNSYGDEIGLEAAITKGVTLGNFLRFYAGIGTNLGYTYNNQLTISGLESWTLADGETNSAPTTDYSYTDNHFDMKDGLSQRLYVTGGMSFVFFRRLELGVESRYGLGYRWHFQDNPIFTNLQSYGLVARWQLKSRL